MSSKLSELPQALSLSNNDLFLISSSGSSKSVPYSTLVAGLPTGSGGSGTTYVSGTGTYVNGTVINIGQDVRTTDTVRFAKAGIGITNTGSTALMIGGSGQTGASQFGASCDITSTSTATSNSFGLYTRSTLITGSYTTTRAGGIYVDNMPVISGPTLTQQIGVFVNDQSRGVNNFGVYCNVSAASGKWGWYGNGSADNYSAGSWILGNTSLPTVSSGQVAICSAGSALNARHSDASNNNYTTRLTRGDNVVASGSGNITFNLNDGLVRLFTLTGNATLAVSNVVAGDIIKFRLQQDGVGSRTITWFNTIKWAGGSAPTLTTTANKADWITIICTSSGNYDGAVAMANV